MPFRRFTPAQLPAHETVFAMSVHKAQGSELDQVALILPEQSSPVVTRELIYTAITRARSKVVIFGSRAVLAKAIETPVQRASGLSDLLWK
jgi:exodeoxyribonuclease V alpha subunit